MQVKENHRKVLLSSSAAGSYQPKYYVRSKSIYRYGVLLLPYYLLQVSTQVAAEQAHQSGKKNDFINKKKTNSPINWLKRSNTT